MPLRLAIAALAAVALIGILVGALGWLTSRVDPDGNPWRTVDRVAMLRSSIGERYAVASDFERVGNAVIVPVDKAPDLLRQCSRATVSPIDGYWRPTAGMVQDFEAQLAELLRGSADFEPLSTYAGQYAGVVSGSRRVIYAGFVSMAYAEGWQRRVVQLCGGGHKAFGVELDFATKTLGELRVNGPR